MHNGRQNLFLKYLRKKFHKNQGSQRFLVWGEEKKEDIFGNWRSVKEKFMNIYGTKQPRLLTNS